ncbi:MAG: bifunctional diaminohydroxyphosphoribosylaminopyrimidine deaminase/5-amino-6-(5-phosphoribosylamino)uracil reductase RibD [Candidatus Zixiibacteriota bacterium]
MSRPGTKTRGFLYMQNERLMHLALRLAEKGRGTTSPNPMVGALVTKGDGILAEGYHKKFGGPHAEAVALHACGDQAKGATLYVNLEPCCHYGKTPPCTDLIIQSGIRKVVCSTIDPNPQVNGKGIRSLKKAGIKTRVGILEREATRLNEAYFKYINTGLPFVVLKVVTGLNGKTLAPDVLTKRQEAAILAGSMHPVNAGTDAILLDGDLVGSSCLRQPGTQKHSWIILGTWNEIWRKRGRLKKTGDGNMILVPVDDQTTGRKAGSRYQIWKAKKRKDGSIDLLRLLKQAGGVGIASLLVEAGPQISTSFLRNRLVDKIWYQLIPDILGKGEEPFDDLGIRRISEAVTLRDCEYVHLKDSLLVVGYPAFL